MANLYWSGLGPPTLQDLGGAPKAGAIYVDPGGNGDYTTLAAALAAAVSGDEIVCGDLVESLNATVPAGVRIRGDHFGQEVVLSSLDGVSPTLTFAGGGTVREITMVTPPTSGVPALDCTGLSAGELVVLFNVPIQGGGSGIGVKGAGSGVVAAIQGFYHNGGTLEQLVLLTSGTLIGEGWITNVGVADDVIKVTGGTARIATIQSQDSALYSCTDYIEISGGSLIVAGLGMPNNGVECATNAIHISGDGCDLEISGSPLRSTTWDVLVDPALVGTGSRVHIMAEADFGKRSIPAGYRDVADTRFNFGTETGWASYQDTTHTSGSPQAFADGVRALWTNNNGVKLEDYRPASAALFTGNKIAPTEVGQAYTLRIDFTYVPGGVNTSIDFDLDIGSNPLGGSSIIIARQTVTAAKGTATQYATIGFPIYCLATFVANGGSIHLTAQGNDVDVFDKVITLVRIH